MTNNLFYVDKEKQNQLLKIIDFKSKLDKKVIFDLDSTINNNIFVKENYKNMTITFDLEQQIDNIKKACLILDSSKDYTWDNIWNNFKKVIFEQKLFDDYYKCNIIFKWILLLIYLGDKEKNNCKYFFLVHKKCEELFLNINLGFSYKYDKSKLINFNNEIILDLDNINFLLKKIKDFYKQLDFFLTENISCLWNEFNFSYMEIKEEIQKNQYFFQKEKLSKLLMNNDAFISNFTTINNLNLPIIYIFIKYLIDNNFLLFKEKIINDFLKIISKNLKIKNISLLKKEIIKIINNRNYYQKNNNFYILKLENFNNNSNFEEKIFNTLRMMIEDVTYIHHY